MKLITVLTLTAAAFLNLHFVRLFYINKSFISLFTYL